MRCPKEETELTAGQMIPGLPAQDCPDCGGAWIAATDYKGWQAERTNPDAVPAPKVLPSSLETDFQPAPLDGRAGLCPECGYYLVRARINLSKVPFYVERCRSCEGIWCDRGEWPILEQLGIDTHIGSIFLPEWQAQLRRLETDARERQATVEKLGPEIANRIFELAALLEAHPQGDFGVAYLMRHLQK